MPDSTRPDPSRPTSPTIREIAELTARLRDLSARGRDADPAERAAFLADKDALLAHIPDATTTAAYATDLSDVVLARAAGPGYVLVGPSARTWLRDPDTGHPATEVSEAEHHAVRELLGHEILDTTEPEWVTGLDGRTDVHSPVIVTDDAEDSVDLPEEMRAAAAAWGPDGPPPGSGRPDDPAVIAERIGELRAANGPSHVEEIVSRADAAARLVELGFDPSSADTMITEYQHEASRSVGVPVYQWGLDQTDVDAITDTYRWVARDQGESLDDARARAGRESRRWTGRAAADPEQAPRSELAARLWADRARVPEPFTPADEDDDQPLASTPLVEQAHETVSGIPAPRGPADEAEGWEQLSDPYGGEHMDRSADDQSDGDAHAMAFTDGGER